MQANSHTIVPLDPAVVNTAPAHPEVCRREDGRGDPARRGNAVRRRHALGRSADGGGDGHLAGQRASHLWREAGHAPHRWRNLKLWNDRALVERVGDVLGLHVERLEHGVVW